MKTKLLRLIRKEVEIRYYHNEGIWMTKTKRDNSFCTYDTLRDCMKTVMCNTIGTNKAWTLIRKNRSKKEQNVLRTKWNRILPYKTIKGEKA